MRGSVKIDFSDEEYQAMAGAVFGEMLFHFRCVEECMRNPSLNEYAQNRMLRDALSMRLQRLGELCGKLAKKGVDGKWGEFRETLDMVSHDPASVNVMRHWKILRGALPRLKAAVSAVSEEYPVIAQSAKMAFLALSGAEKANVREFLGHYGIEDKYGANAPAAGKRRATRAQDGGCPY